MLTGIQAEAKTLLETKLITEGVNLRSIEQEIISNITKMGPENYENRLHNLYWQTSELLDKLTTMPFGKSASEFHNNPLLDDYLKKTAYLGDFGLWLLVERFLVAVNNKSDIAEKYALEIMELKLKTLSDEIHRKNGCGMFHLEWNIILNVYLSNNQKLIQLFAKYLPVPRRNKFTQTTLPTFLVESENKATLEIIKVMTRNHWDFDSVEQKIIVLQRQFRFKRRMREERNRIKERLDEISGISKDIKISAEEMIMDANIPYLPQKCNRKLAIRLYTAAKKVKLFTTVRHLTSQTALMSMFDDAIYGNRTLNALYIPFRRAALDFTDIEYGDGNAICFGANEIDSDCIKMDNMTVEIIMDLDKIKQNSCLFFKQQDFGYELERTRKFVLGEKEFLFSHTSARFSQKFFKSSCFVLYHPPARLLLEDTDVYAYSKVFHPSLISYNSRKMHQILALNFFRFIDALCIVSKQSFTSKINTPIINLIYSELEKLSDDKLVSFLEDVGRQLSDTMEFNFYGSHKMNFDSILFINTIQYEQYPSVVRPYGLNLPQFIESMQNGNVVALQEARNHLPNLFKSYRFVNYLISKKPATSVLHELQKDQNQFILPFYMQNLSESEKRKIEAHKQRNHDKQFGLVLRKS